MSFEINIIWLGPNVMPEQQLNNLDKIAKDLIGNHINIWITPDLIDASLKERWESKGYCLQDISSLSSPSQNPNTHRIINLLKANKIWSGLGDILKFLILSRPLVKDCFGKRFYIEPDNNYHIGVNESIYLENVIKDRTFVYHLGYTGGIRCDSFYLDVNPVDNSCEENKFAGLILQKRLATALELFLGDYHISRSLEKFIKQQKKSEKEILYTFGEIPGFLLLRTLAPSFTSTHQFSERWFSFPSQFESRSWLNSDVKNVDNRDTSIEAKIIYLRIYQLIADCILPPALKVSTYKNASLRCRFGINKPFISQFDYEKSEDLFNKAEQTAAKWKRTKDSKWVEDTYCGFRPGFLL